MGEATSILISAEMELSITSKIVTSGADNILKEKLGLHIFKSTKGKIINSADKILKEKMRLATYLHKHMSR